jgi:hypothetical protein
MNKWASSTEPANQQVDSAQSAFRSNGNRTMGAAFVAAGAVVTILAVTAIRFAGPAGDAIEPAATSAPSSAGTTVAAAQASTTADEAASDWAARVEVERLRAESNARAERNAFVQRYENESVDPPWSAVKEATLLRASTSTQITELGAEPGNLGIDCKSSVCRVTADFSNSSLAEDWVTLFMLNAGSEMPRAVFDYSNNPDRSVHVVILGYSRNSTTRTSAAKGK